MNDELKAAFEKAKKESIDSLISALPTVIYFLVFAFLYWLGKFIYGATC